MTTHDMTAASGALSQGVLAILFIKVWSSLRPRWALLLGLSFAANAVYFLRVVAGYYVEPLASVPQAGNAALVLTGLVLCTAGLLDHAGVGAVVARRINAFAVGTAAATFAGVASGLVTRRAGLCVWGVFVLGWAILSAWAMLREPRHGHGFVVLALLSYSAAVVAVLRGDFDPALLTAAHAAPMATLGMTLLTTGLLRGQRLALQERQRANCQLLGREQAESQLRLAHETLEQTVAARTAELREAIAGLESFNRTISHDLRGPLGGIAGVARLARDHVAQGDKVAAERMLQAISDQAETSQKLVGALLAMARSSDATLQRQTVDSEALVLEVVDSLRHAAPSERFSIVVAQLPPVAADPELLRQVFVNLIGNALKFSAGTPRPHIEVGARLHADGGATTFHVRDNGVGFAAADAKRLFAPFQRLHGLRFDGFGVGLSIVKRIVERHGGSVWASANTGGGATFFFTLQPGVHDPAKEAARDHAFVLGLLQRPSTACCVAES